MAKIVFKELTSNQNVLFPVSLSEKIAPNHPVRIVNSVVDALFFIILYLLCIIFFRRIFLYNAFLLKLFMNRLHQMIKIRDK